MNTSEVAVEAAISNETPKDILSEFGSFRTNYKGHEIMVVPKKDGWVALVRTNHWFLFSFDGYEDKQFGESLRLAKEAIDKVHEHLTESKADRNISKRLETTVLNWPTLWKIQSDLGFVDPLGGDEYRMQTLEAIKSGKVKLWDSHLIVEVEGIVTEKFILGVAPIS